MLFDFGTRTSKDCRLLPLHPPKARETKTDSECPPSQLPVLTQIKTDADSRDEAEKRQRAEVGKAGEEGQESEGERGIGKRCHRDALQGERQMRQALAEEKEGKGARARGILG